MAGAADLLVLADDLLRDLEELDVAVLRIGVRRMCCVERCTCLRDGRRFGVGAAG
jgi:hypothetical protein